VGIVPAPFFVPDRSRAPKIILEIIREYEYHIRGVSMKTCQHCKISQPESNFCKDRNQKDGLKPRCKTCTHEYFEAHKKQIEAQTDAWRKAHPERWAELQHKYYLRRKARKNVESPS
jgi:hypothetical protein